MQLKFLSIKWWEQTIDITPLVLFRVVFGFLLACEGFGAIATGWVYKTFIEPQFTFNFIGFEFLQPLPGWGMYAWFIVLGISGLMIMLGWYYRLFMFVYALLWTAVYLMQKSHYNNHYYLTMLLCWLMLLVPANKSFSLDVKWRNFSSDTYCQRWHIYVFIALLWIVYTYAAIAKLYPDWLQAIPIKLWFKQKTNYPIIGFIYENNIVHYLVAYGGIIFDALIIPLLLWKPSRKWAFGIAIFFHLFNSITFQIGIFPYLMIGSAVLFWRGEELRKIFSKFINPDNFTKTKSTAKSPKWALYLIFIFLGIQILLPLRHHYFSGNVLWTEEGHRLSWRMMLRSKSGNIYFDIKNIETGKTTKLYPKKYLTKDQVSALSKHPDMIWQFIQFLKKQLPKEGVNQFEIYVKGKVKVNNHPRKPLINPDYNMAEAEWHWYKHEDWITEFGP